MEKTSLRPRLILASASPRRRFLLEQAGVKVEQVSSRFDEKSVPPRAPGPYARRLAVLKAAEVAARHPDRWVLAADTVVFIDRWILGKPASAQEAVGMLHRLSGRVHRVATGYCICRRSTRYSFSETVITEVEFKRLSSDEIQWYVDSGEPFDKAGAYGIQGRGSLLVKRINGSYSNVVGLPVCEVCDCLRRQGVIR